MLNTGYTLLLLLTHYYRSSANSWNLTKHNLNGLCSFHQSAIRRILGYHWEQVKEQCITNKMIRKEFKNIPTVVAFIIQWVWRYIGQMIWDNENSIPKKMLGAWIKPPKKQGQPQMSSQNNHTNSLKEILKNKIPNINSRGIFNEWTYHAKCENTWETLADDYFWELQPKRTNPDSTDDGKVMNVNCAWLSSLNLLDWEWKISESLFLWFQKVRMENCHFHLSVH